METPVGIRIEPSLIRVRDTPSGQFQVIVDNRQGIRPRRVTLAGTDPERSIGFSFWPPVVDVAAGQIARSQVRIDAYPPEPGKDVTRQFSVAASDGAKEVETDGTFIQSTSPPPPDEPMTIRLEPSVLRTRNRRNASATVFADNRGGSRPRRVQFGGHDPERAVRFSFNPPVLDLAPGQSGAVRVEISAPRPDGGEEVTRPFTVVATDGSKETEATGSFVQESSDWRPVWRAILTVLGAVLMIVGRLPPVERRSDAARDRFHGESGGPTFRSVRADSTSGHRQPAVRLGRRRDHRAGDRGDHRSLRPEGAAHPMGGGDRRGRSRPASWCRWPSTPCSSPGSTSGRSSCWSGVCCAFIGGYLAPARG